MDRFGQRIKQIRSKKFGTVASAAKAMQDAGYKMSADQLYRLEKGKWPNRDQVKTLCGFFKLNPAYLLCGIHEVTLNDLDDIDRAIIIRLIRRLANPPPVK